MNIDTRKIVRVISLIVLIASLCVLAVYIIGDLRDAKTEDDIKGLKGNDVKVPEVLDEYAGLYAENSDTIGWLKIDGMTIDYVVMQAPDEINKYLRHDFYGKDSTRGCLFVDEYCDILSSDNLIIYGHNMKSGMMSRNLHDFEDRTFFDNNKYIYIYTEEETMVYEIYAAYTANDAHILNTNDFSTELGRQAYLETSLAKAEAGGGNVRDEVEVTSDSVIITLSTCTSRSDQRYLVQALRIK